MSATALGSAKLTEHQLEDLISKAKQWALLHGVQMFPPGEPVSSSEVQYAPITLFPSLIPVDTLQRGKDLQTEYNRLMHKVAYDHEFLKQTLENVIKVDAFTRMLWDIYTTVREEGITQPYSLGLFRNDFMIDAKPTDSKQNGQTNGNKTGLKQIEFNTVAASFGGMACGIWRVHRYTMAKAGVKFNDQQIPVNAPCCGFANGLIGAWEKYGEKKAVILFVVQRNERNKIDQKWLERKVFENNRDISVEYVTLKEAYDKSTLKEDKSLFINGKEVAVIYFRDGYSPDHYPTNKEVEVRLIFERCRAIKCPSVCLQLAGCKKVQQALAGPGAVERFIPDTAVCSKIRETFAGQFSLDKGKIGDETIKLAMKSPDHYVLKPQREGGGNNIYGNDICDFLNDIKDSDERSAYILMERIFPLPQKNHLLKEGKSTELRNVVSEIGIYGVYLGSSTEELLNEQAGHVIRTKSDEDNEGGICAGFATIDSPFLVESDVNSIYS